MSEATEQFFPSNSYTATIQLTNNTGSKVLAQLYHKNSMKGLQSSGTIISAHSTATVLTVNFTDVGNADTWFLVFHRTNNTSGTYVSGGSGSTIKNPTWTPWNLQPSDNGQTLTFSVDSSSSTLTFTRGNTSSSTTLSKLRAWQAIQNVFVVMLENHSFDNMLAFSGISGITRKATTANTNTYSTGGSGTATVAVSKGALASMPHDPPHEFDDVLEQLCGASAKYTSGGTYPTRNNSGFAANYSGVAGTNSTNVQKVMQCFDTASQLPVLNDLATNFQVCQQWYSSMPGPTWPNRIFAHCGSSGGMDDSPGLLTMLEVAWDGGLRPPKGTVYEKIKATKWPSSTQYLGYRFYQDCQSTVGTIMGEAATAIAWALWWDDPLSLLAANFAIPSYSLYASSPIDSLGVAGLGWIPQSYLLKGVSSSDFYSMKSYTADLNKPYDPAYTFIEPHYGDMLLSSFQGGTSQHPKDGTNGGEALLKAVYEGLRNSPLWYTSLLVVVYDEHGGFYDSVAPGTATAPGDGGSFGNEHGYTFKTYGARVPAIVISPLLSAGVSDTTYDHSSVPKTLEQIFGFSHLTARDSGAYGVKSLCTLSISGGTVRTDCPTTLPNPVPAAATQPLTAEEREALLAEPLPERGNLLGTLGAVFRADLSTSDGSEDWLEQRRARILGLKTRGDALAYVSEVLRRLNGYGEAPTEGEGSGEAPPEE